MYTSFETIQFIDRQQPYGVDKDFTDIVSAERFERLKKHYANAQFNLADLHTFETACQSHTNDTIEKKLSAVLEHVKSKHPLPHQNESSITKPAEYSEERMVAIVHAAAAIEYLITNNHLPEGKVYLSLHNLIINIVYEDYESANLWVMEEDRACNELTLYNPLEQGNAPGFIKNSELLKERFDYCSEIQNRQRFMQANDSASTALPAFTIWGISNNNSQPAAAINSTLNSKQIFSA